MGEVKTFGKVYEAGYKTQQGQFHREVLFEHEKDIFLNNLEEDRCSLSYIREANPNDIEVMIKIADDAQLRRLVELATSEMYQRLINNKININHK